MNMSTTRSLCVVGLMNLLFQDDQLANMKLKLNQTGPIALPCVFVLEKKLAYKSFSLQYNEKKENTPICSAL